MCHYRMFKKLHLVLEVILQAARGSDPSPARRQFAPKTRQPDLLVANAGMLGIVEAARNTVV